MSFLPNDRRRNALDANLKVIVYAPLVYSSFRLVQWRLKSQLQTGVECRPKSIRVPGVHRRGVEKELGDDDTVADYRTRKCSKLGLCGRQ